MTAAQRPPLRVISLPESTGELPSEDRSIAEIRRHRSEAIRSARSAHPSNQRPTSPSVVRLPDAKPEPPA